MQTTSCVPESLSELPGPSAEVKRLLRLYLFVLVALFVLSWISIFVARDVLHRSHPFDTPYFSNPLDGSRFADWTNFTERVAHYGEKDVLARTDLGYPYPYPLPSFYLYLAAVRLTHDNLLAYQVATVFIFGVAGLLFSLRIWRITHRMLPQFAIVATLLLGFPAFFLYDRGNIEVFIWLFIVIGLVSFLRRWNVAAILFFALAGSMKIYPAIFLLLFISRKQYKAFIGGIIATAAISLFSIWNIGPSIPLTIQQMRAGAIYLKQNNIISFHGDANRFDHSVLAEAKKTAVTLWRRHERGEIRFQGLVKAYSILAPLAFILIYFLRIRRLPLLNQFLALTLLSILLPYVSYEYTLIHVYTMLGVLLVFLLTDVSRGRAALNRKQMTVLMVCFAVVMAPLSVMPMTLFEGQVKGLVLLVMLVLVLAAPMPSALFGDLEQPPSDS